MNESDSTSSVINEQVRIDKDSTMTSTCVNGIRDLTLIMFKKYPFIVQDYYLYYYFSDFIYYKIKHKPSSNVVKSRLKRLYEIFVSIHSKIVRIINHEIEFNYVFNSYGAFDNAEYKNIVIYVINVIHENLSNPSFKVKEITYDSVREIMQDYM